MRIGTTSIFIGRSDHRDTTEYAPSERLQKQVSKRWHHGENSRSGHLPATAYGRNGRTARLDDCMQSDGNELQNRPKARPKAGCKLVRQRLSPIDTSMEKYRPRQAPNLPTIRKIQAMAEYRERTRDPWGRPPTWTSVCRKFHMNYRTLRRQAPELFEKWNDPDFHW
jgi:hypothetical protein